MPSGNFSHTSGERAGSGEVRPHAPQTTIGRGGTLVGDSGTILRTSNGGETWVSQTSGTTSALNGVSFSDTDTGTAVGGRSSTPSGATILRTTNGGNTWTAQATTLTNILNGVSFTDADTGVAVGNVGQIVATTDGGGSWEAKSRGPTATLNAVSFADAN